MSGRKAMRWLAVLSPVWVAAGCHSEPTAPDLLLSAGRTTTYEIVDLGLPGLSSGASAIDARGRIVGSYTSATTVPRTRGFIWEDGDYVDIGTPGVPGDIYLSIAPVGINAQGQLAVNVMVRGGVPGLPPNARFNRAYLYDSNTGEWTNLGYLDASYPYAVAAGINARGQIVGYSVAPVADHPFMWEDGILNDLDPNGGNGEAMGVTNSGLIVGLNWSAGATTWKDGQATVLGSLSSLLSQCWAAGANERGQVVGLCQGSGGRRAVLWQDGAATDLGALGGNLSGAAGINAAGIIVGGAETSGGEQHAFAWSGGVMTDLGTLGGSSSYAAAVNPRGWIVGSAAQSDGNTRAVVWMPK